MCGVTGVITHSLTSHQLQQGIQESCSFLRSRGPDQTGNFVQTPAAFGVCRLAIRDPLKGQQPMERAGYVITFNGELYQTEELKNKILSHGWTLETESDTELLLLGFIIFGPLVFSTLSGMFACSIWDIKKEVLYLARDRFGEKPLYYTQGKTQGEDFFAFASEIKAFSAWPFINWDLCVSDLHLFLTHSYLPGLATGWETIQKLPTGCYLIYKQGSSEKVAYHTHKVSEEIDDHPVTSKHLLSLLEESVKNCCISDKPVGAFLSGGIDSTTVSALLSKYVRGAPLFSLHWDHPSYSEEFYTTAAAVALGLNHFSTTCSAAFIMEHFTKLVSLYDEPFADESMIPTYCLSLFAKEHVDVVLTGDGADELFLGYERYGFTGDLAEYLNIFCAIPSDVHARICEPDFLALKSLSSTKFTVPPIGELSSHRHRSYLDLLHYLPYDILMKVDRASMGASLETRAPFLTPNVANFALKCSSSALKQDSSSGKKILRSAVKDIIPPLILKRKKMGFGVPLKDWFCSSLKSWMMTRLLEGELYQMGWFSREGVLNLIQSHLNGEKNHARALFNLLILEEWIRNRPQGKNALLL
ncbi:MAG: asparagine synthase (glutamine-hydrolyzing) [Candidatus Rhabdochlamydia sp.]